MKLFRTLLFVITIVAGSSCGGGGGGSGSTDTDNSAPTGARIIHGAIDVAPLQLKSSAKSDAIETAPFAAQSLYGALPLGAQSLTITSSDSPNTVRFQYDLDVQTNHHHTIFVFGNDEFFGTEAALLDDTVPALTSGASAIRVLHGSVGALNIRIKLDGQPWINSVPFGTASAYDTIPSGAHTIEIFRAADGQEIAADFITLTDGKGYSLAAVGEVGYAVFLRLYED